MGAGKSANIVVEKDYLNLVLKEIFSVFDAFIAIKIDIAIIGELLSVHRVINLPLCMIMERR